MLLVLKLFVETKVSGSFWEVGRQQGGGGGGGGGRGCTLRGLHRGHKLGGITILGWTNEHNTFHGI